MFAVAAIVLACADNPTAPARSPDESRPRESTPRDTSTRRPAAAGRILVERARVLDRKRATLLSSREDIAAGRLRYRVLDSALPDIERDDFLVTYTDSAVVR